MVYLKTLACFFMFLTACSVLKKQAIDIYLSSAKDQKAELSSFKAPPPIYEKKSHQTLDALWSHKTLQVSISYFSSCSKLNQSLKAFQSSAYPQNLSYQLIQSDNQWGGLYSVLKFSDSDSYIAIHTKKKGDCYVNLNFVAPSKSSFDSELKNFHQFIQQLKLK